VGVGVVTLAAVVAGTGASHLGTLSETVEQALTVLPAASATAAMQARVTCDIKSMLIN